MANLVKEPRAGEAAAPCLVDGHFAIDFDAPLPEAGGGHPAFAARSVRTGPGFMAVQVAVGWPARSAALASIAAAPIAHVLVPFGHGAAPTPSGEVGYFIVCQAPRGPPLAVGLRPWAEQDLVDMLVRPAAVALAGLHERNVTHRAIRLENVFRPSPADPVTLGAAWAAPPASRQPCLYEPPYSAVCLPGGRGDGAPGDDIYALGALLLVLALGRDPMAGMDDDAIVRSKLEHGSFAAMAGRNRLPTAVAELARGMLADDPEHRPSAVLLGDPAAARARRAAARPPRRAQRPYPLGEPPAWTARELARAIMLQPEQGAAQLRSGAIGMWLRRGIGDGPMASRTDEACNVRDGASGAEEPQADSLLATRAVAVLDPLAPLAWRRLALWPDGLGAALNQALHAGSAQAGALAEIAMADVAMSFGLLRRDRSDMALLREESRKINAMLSARQPESAALRLSYALNPLAPCESPLLAGRWVACLADLLPALEIAAAGPLRGKQPPVDRHVTAFVAMRRDERTQGEFGLLANAAATGDVTAQLRLLARLQERTHPGELPALTAWLAELVAPLTHKFHGNGRRAQVAERLADLGRLGRLPPLLTLLDDRDALAADAAGHRSAMARGAAIDVELRDIEKRMKATRVAAEKTALNLASGASLAACGVALAAAMFL